MTRIPSSSRRQLLLSAVAGVGAASLWATNTASAGANGAVSVTGDVHDFDFSVGTWHCTNRRLKKRWVGSNDWEEFAGELSCSSYLGGVVNISEVAFPTKGWSGITVRAFNLEKRQWSNYWINSKTGVLFPPIVGGFTRNRGEFYGDDTDEGRPVKVRVVWTRPNADTAIWEQAFSLDGQRWETNWTSEHHRAKA